MTKRIYLSPPDVGDEERALLLDAYDSNWIAPVGPHVDAFEREIAARCAVGHAAALSSGTAALHLALRLAGIGPGDEVITSTLTFAATANAITYTGAAPVFVDVDAETWTLDAGLFAEEIERCAKSGKVPKAVIPVDLYGQCADYDAINEACRRHGIVVIEDAAEALGARYGGRPAGSLGELGILSFNGNKIITTSGGGMLLSNDGSLVERARFLASQARDPAPHYEHSTIGYNYRLSNLLAAIGRAQLRKLDDRVSKRRRINSYYREQLGDLVDFMPEASYGRSTFWLTCGTLTGGRAPESVLTRLEAQDVEARPLWKPMHMQRVFNGSRVRGGQVAEGLFRRGLCLPSGSSLSPADLERIVAAVRSSLV